MPGEKEKAGRKKTREELLREAQSPDKTPFDYVVVGSGAGGGPLAARLAREGKRVLVIEAGSDPALKTAKGGDPAIPEAFEEWGWREVYSVPGYHAAATEDPDMSWQFSVRHYECDTTQKGDRKYNEDKDPQTKGKAGKGGILYPRCSALGGCTAHNAMIIVRPNDYDWERIAVMTGDDSWRAERMQGYFARIEKCMYEDLYRGFIGKIAWHLGDFFLWLVTFINPRSQLDRAGHGFSGWQKTSFVSPMLVWSIVRKDPTFRKLLVTVFRSLLSNRRLARWWWRAVLHLHLSKALDANDLNKRRQSPGGLNFVPVATDGSRRSGLREWLLETARDYPDRLVIETGAFTRRILFTCDSADVPPRAHGVEVEQGLHLYKPDSETKTSGVRKSYFARQEVIVCGGAFNSPQLLMLSGIGDPAQLAEKKIDGIHRADGSVKVVELAGVGKNLQDRYEIGVISELNEEFECLQNASFQPDDKNDPIASEWRRVGEGLYTTNGGAVALLLDSKVSPDLREGNHSIPDLLIVGFPAAFRGYYWGWSKELFMAPKGDEQEHEKTDKTEQRNLWSWVILKGYTSNSGGVVQLRTSDPFDQPEINFHSFDEGPAGHEEDMRALTRAIKYLRQLNAQHGSPFEKELQPGENRPDDSEELRHWIRAQAWGHHACGTCRIGADRWQGDTRKLCDKDAVVDSQFRVHGVRGLRVVDAAVFPQIPGYFIVAAIFMIGEKAADVILSDSAEYPHELEYLEAEAVRRRRLAAKGDAGQTGGLDSVRDPSTDGRLPPRTVGLALSGGGVRSATFSLGVLQVLAEKNILRSVDFLSTVSGGGFAGGFVGRLFTRLVDGIGRSVADKVGHVQQVLKETNSAQMWWLRRHANYILAGGRPELYLDLGIFWRNLVALHFTIAALFLGVFGALRWFADWFWQDSAEPIVRQLVLTPWWGLPLVVLLVAIGPLSLGFWLTPKGDTRGTYPLFSLLAWIVLLIGAAIAFALPSMKYWAAAATGMLLLAWLWQELARWGVPNDGRLEPLAKSIVVRNRVSRYLGLSVLALLGTALWVLLDTWARYTACNGWGRIIAATTASLSMALPILGMLITRFTSGGKSVRPIGLSSRLLVLVTTPIAYGLFIALLFAIDTTAHWAFEHGTSVGIFVTVLALVFSRVVGCAFDVLNRSSLQSAYSERVSRAFLGAANDARTHPTQSEEFADVLIADPNDDLAFDRYHPECAGGPLHLINVCVNETADAVSGRRLREDRGLPMCMGPQGVSVGLRHHAVWEVPKHTKANFVRRLVSSFEGPSDPDLRKVALRALAIDSDPEAFHVLGRRDRNAASVEPLRLSQWLGISAAALTTGMGRKTRMPLSLLLGLLNLRMGYWWDSGIEADDRPDRYPPSFLRRIVSFGGWLFKVQGKILNEWRGYFAGPSDRHWYLTDGGHFENIGLYELIRRKLPFIIAVDATEDAGYQFGDLALLTRQARVDFGAEFSWMDPAPARKAGKTDWIAIDAATMPAVVPDWIRPWLNPDAIGGMQEITRTGRYAAALARISYRGNDADECWLLLVKPAVAAVVPLDVHFYANQSDSFPNEPTADQFFDGEQWESYRRLGQELGWRIFKEPKKG